MKHLRPNRQGFTLIEITIFLAIAGLLVAFVFIAYDRGQRGRRDNTREVDLGLVADNLEKYKNSNYGGGQYPSASTFVTEFTPSGAGANPHGFALQNHQDPLAHQDYIYGSTQSPAAGQPAGISYTYGYACGVDTGVTAVAGTYRLTIGLESSSTGFCVDNH